MQPEWVNGDWGSGSLMGNLPVMMAPCKSAFRSFCCTICGFLEENMETIIRSSRKLDIWELRLLVDWLTPSVWVHHTGPQHIVSIAGVAARKAHTWKSKQSHDRGNLGKKVPPFPQHTHTYHITPTNLWCWGLMWKTFIILFCRALSPLAFFLFLVLAVSLLGRL